MAQMAFSGALAGAQGEVVLAARNVSKFYEDARSAGGRILVLDDITLELRAGEFVALLGPSGSGKSTLLRILAGLVAPSSGQVLLHDQPLQAVNPAVAIVFQTFALYPWLTVLENVEFGLLAKDLPAPTRHARAVRAIDLVGLDGFESAYPRELSGGMKQRVGLARALVVEPEALFLDEPFSALDVLVAENLRHEIGDLWRERKLSTRAMLMVTHNIDEAVTMAAGHVAAGLPAVGCVFIVACPCGYLCRHPCRHAVGVVGDARLDRRSWAALRAPRRHAGRLARRGLACWRPPSSADAPPARPAAAQASRAAPDAGGSSAVGALHRRARLALAPARMPIGGCRATRDRPSPR